MWSLDTLNFALHICTDNNRVGHSPPLLYYELLLALVGHIATTRLPQ